MFCHAYLLYRLDRVSVAHLLGAFGPRPHDPGCSGPSWPSGLGSSRPSLALGPSTLILGPSASSAFSRPLGLGPSTLRSQAFRPPTPRSLRPIGLEAFGSYHPGSRAFGHSTSEPSALGPRAFTGPPSYDPRSRALRPLEPSGTFGPSTLGLAIRP